MTKLDYVKNFKPLNDIIGRLNDKQCWLMCDDCKTKWAQLKTVNVHMKVRNIDGVVATRFICDSCMESAQPSN